MRRTITEADLFETMPGDDRGDLGRLAAEAELYGVLAIEERYNGGDWGEWRKTAVDPRDQSGDKTNTQ